MKSALNINGSKYKLHKMQEKIESEERDNSNRASFMCPNCQKTFTDLEVSLNNYNLLDNLLRIISQG